MRETVRELGERRASGFLKKFYGWYLGRGRFPRPFKQELVQLETTVAEVEARLFDGRAGRAIRSRPHRAGAARGGRGLARRHADLDLRRRMTESLRGQLLIASPALIDPNFRRTVVLVVAHDEDGAVGLVLNRPTETEVAEAVPELAELVEPDAVVSIGGPVQNEAVVVLAEWDDTDEAGAIVFDDIGLMGARGGAPSASPRRRAACASSPATRAGAAASSRPSSSEPSWVVEDAALDEDVFGGEPTSGRPSCAARAAPFNLVATMPRRDPSLQLVAFSSQTSRRPSSVSHGIDALIVRECGAISSARPPVAIARASTPSSPRMRVTISSTWPVKP